jgi:hypothetical protein
MVLNLQDPYLGVKGSSNLLLHIGMKQQLGKIREEEQLALEKTRAMQLL